MFWRKKKKKPTITYGIYDYYYRCEKYDFKPYDYFLHIAFYCCPECGEQEKFGREIGRLIMGCYPTVTGIEWKEEEDD